MRINGINGFTADVTENGSLRTRAITTTASETLNDIGGVFRVSGTVTPAGADDVFFYLQNTGTFDLVLSVIAVSSSVTTKITTEIVTGTPSFALETPAQATNLNLGSSITLPAIANVDTNITGLASEGELSFIECDVVDRLFEDEISSGIFIPQGKAIAMRRTESTGEITFSLGIGIQLIT